MNILVDSVHAKFFLPFFVIVMCKDSWDWKNQQTYLEKLLAFEIWI